MGDAAHTTCGVTEPGSAAAASGRRTSGWNRRREVARSRVGETRAGSTWRTLRRGVGTDARGVTRAQRKGRVAAARHLGRTLPSGNGQPRRRVAGKSPRRTLMGRSFLGLPPGERWSEYRHGEGGQATDGGAAEKSLGGRGPTRSCWPGFPPMINGPGTMHTHDSVFLFPRSGKH